MNPILTLSDLQSAPFSDRCGTRAEPVFFAVFGKPIGHSLSPLMQNAAIAQIARDDPLYTGSTYFAFEIDPDELGEILPVFWEKNFAGINLTIPHKEVAMKFADELDISAERAGACNTLLRTKRGWRGYNTDGFGIIAAVENAFGKKFAGADVAILGAGGAARGAASAISAESPKTLLVANRSAERLQKFADDLRAENIAVQTSALEGVEAKIPDGAIVINATSVGLKEDDAPAIDFSKIPPSCVFFDMPYRRGMETSSVNAARKYGIRAESGLAMLAWQGAKSLSIWTGKPLGGLAQTMLKTLKEA